MADLRAFVKESNRIEGITRAPTAIEMREHAEFLALDAIDIDHMKRFVSAIARRTIRDQPGMNVRVGNHRPPDGGPLIPVQLMLILKDVQHRQSPYGVHHAYETLHPFMDGNGRSGRVLWLWQMIHQVQDPYVLKRGFLHSWYYQSLGAGRPA